MLRIDQTYHIKASPERVWAALTNPALMTKWSGTRAEYNARVGGANSKSSAFSHHANPVGACAKASCNGATAPSAATTYRASRVYAASLNNIVVAIALPDGVALSVV